MWGEPWTNTRRRRRGENVEARGNSVMTKRTDDPIVSRRRPIAREAVLFPGDTPLRDVIAALALKGLDVLDRPIAGLAMALRSHHKERHPLEAAARRQR
jgi:hypothetical protein